MFEGEVIPLGDHQEAICCRAGKPVACMKSNEMIRTGDYHYIVREKLNDFAWRVVGRVSLQGLIILKGEVNGVHDKKTS